MSDVPACALPLSKSAGKEPTPCLCCGSGARVGVTTDATEREKEREEALGRERGDWSRPPLKSSNLLAYERARH